MAEKQLTLPGTIVKKSNALARAKWSVKSIYEPRLVALVASRVRKKDADFYTYEIPIAELTGSKNIDGRTYKLIQESSIRLMSRVIEMKKDNGSWALYNVFSKVEYDSEKGVIRARFDPDMKPHYLGLNEFYISYNLIDFLSLPTTYSQQLFEILKSYDDYPEFTLSIEELHTMLSTPESLRKNFKDFRRRVLEKSHKDIIKRTSLYFEWEPIKKGRRIESVRFIFSRKRSKPVEERKKAKDKMKQSKSNNKLFMSAMECKEKTRGNCSKDKGKVCEVCTKLMV